MIRFGEHRILVIDSDAETKEYIEAYLRPKGLKVVDENDNPDVILLSEDCIDQDLRAQISEYKIKFPTSPIILLLDHEKADGVVERLHDLQAFDIAIKPIHYPQLLVSLRRALIHKLTTPQVIESPRPQIICESADFRKTLQIARKIANSAANVVIYGESGVGKEVIAKFVHQSGRRSRGPFIAINCSAVPEGLLEAEFFGHTKGAFTGAVGARAGLFEEADSGTLFLDEIGELSPTLQAKLLRVLQDREIKKIGENKTKKVDVRVISATHKDLKKEVAEGRFREDLYYRLNVIPLMVPALRERREDILPLADFFLNRFTASNGSLVKGFTPAARERMYEANWPGNVRQLENCIECAVTLVPFGQEFIDVDNLSTLSDVIPTGTKSLSEGFDFEQLTHGQLVTIDELVKEYIKFALNKNNGLKDKTAKALAIDRKTLYRKLHDRSTRTGMNGAASEH